MKIQRLITWFNHTAIYPLLPRGVDTHVPKRYKEIWDKNPYGFYGRDWYFMEELFRQLAC